MSSRPVARAFSSPMHPVETPLRSWFALFLVFLRRSSSQDKTQLTNDKWVTVQIITAPHLGRQRIWISSSAITFSLFLVIIIACHMLPLGDEECSNAHLFHKQVGLVVRYSRPVRARIICWLPLCFHKYSMPKQWSRSMVHRTSDDRTSQ